MAKVVKTLESRMKATKSMAFFSFIFNIIICIIVIVFASMQINNSRKSIYVLNGNVPISAYQTDQSVNRPAEYRSQIDLFHYLFFNLTPDQDFIQQQIEKAVYLCDDSGMQQYNSLKEKGFYSQILSSNAIITITTDSIILDNSKNEFTYYGKQKIDRKTSTTVRSLITSGFIRDVPRSEKNAHGALITNWKTIQNKDIYVKEKSIY